jgi:D-lactate dehydrogenase
MTITFFSTQPYDKNSFQRHAGSYAFPLDFREERLTPRTAQLVTEASVVCAFVNDRIDKEVITALASRKVSLIALRCAGFNNVDLEAAAENGITVVRVPAYSPHAVAEHALAMIMTLNRKTHKAYNRIREQNFSLSGLLGFDLFNKTVGVIGTGNIGRVFCTIMKGLGCQVLAYDPHPHPEVEAMKVPYVPLNDIFTQSDILSLHCPLCLPHSTLSTAIRSTR